MTGPAVVDDLPGPEVEPLDQARQVVPDRGQSPRDIRVSSALDAAASAMPAAGSAPSASRPREFSASVAAVIASGDHPCVAVYASGFHPTRSSVTRLDSSPLNPAATHAPR